MKTVNDIERNRQGTTWAALCLFMAMLFSAIFSGVVSLYLWALTQNMEGTVDSPYPLTALLTLGCVFPGMLVWLKLRQRSRYAALYGLIIAAVATIAVPLWLGVPFASYPE